MLKQPARKYRPTPAVALQGRTWPDAQITEAPIWLSTDLRDGNQALIEPMDLARKLRMFDLLVKIGFKQIEVGFPASSQIEFDFVRQLIEENRIPDDVTIQVMSPARSELLERTVDAVRGAPRAIIHIYNAVAPTWRKVVFNMTVPEVMSLVRTHVSQLKDLTDARPETEWVLQYSPECFSLAELDVSLEACETAIAAWGAGRSIILNLPTTVENATPNVFADQIEWMVRQFITRPEVAISVHPHNDRGTGTASAELALMAGAHRVEGCLFGNGERTGNLDIVNVALNMYVQGVSPGLDFSDIDAIRAEVEHCNQLPVPARHPYAGDLVYTSFSGSHQDAIKKAFAARHEGDLWEMPYLPIDPKDLGRSYEAVIRVNSQSGKGGISYLLEEEFGLCMPRRLQMEFSQVVQRAMDVAGTEFTAQDLWQVFAREYQLGANHALADCRVEPAADADVRISGQVQWAGQPLQVAGQGNGPIDAFVQTISSAIGVPVRVLDYSEHAMHSVAAGASGERANGQNGANATAAAYIELRIGDSQTLYGVGIDSNSTQAAFRAVMSALARSSAAVRAKTPVADTAEA